MALISQSEWARRQGFSKQYVSKLIKQGKIKLMDGMINEEIANSVLMKQRDPSLPLQRKSDGIYEQRDDIYDLIARTKLKNEIERGRILEARAKAEIGRLVSVEEVKKVAFARGRIIRDGLMNIPDRISSLLADENDAAKIHEILSKEIREVLEELSRNTDVEY
jgi:hypothetical protein